MDVKDLELLAQLNKDGGTDLPMLSSALGISIGNVERRIKLLKGSGVLIGRSAFPDRRSFGFETTYLRLHFQGGDLEHALEGVMELPEVAMAYPNMDDFMFLEVVHYDLASLRSIVRALERKVRPFTVTAHYRPRLSDAVPEKPKKAWSELLARLIIDADMPIERISSGCSMEAEEAGLAITTMVRDCGVKFRPLVREELVHPFPAFSVILLLGRGCELSGCYGDIMHISREAWDSIPLFDPPGIWLKCFGRDLHGMDLMLEMYRRLPYVEDLKVILPEMVTFRREVDASMVRNAYRKST